MNRTKNGRLTRGVQGMRVGICNSCSEGSMRGIRMHCRGGEWGIGQFMDNSCDLV